MARCLDVPFLMLSHYTWLDRKRFVLWLAKSVIVRFAGRCGALVSWQSKHWSWLRRYPSWHEQKVRHSDEPDEAMCA
jgi:hypothetical protein